MNIDHPSFSHIPQLRSLWKEAFGDTDAFLDHFYCVAFSPLRCMCVTKANEVLAAAYWFPCGEYAYIYAVATAQQHRGKGICHALMEKIHSVLVAEGYSGCILVPGEESLRQFYRTMKYENFGGVHEFDAIAGSPIQLRKLSLQEYSTLRKEYLPQGGVLQEGVNLEFLSRWAEFYEGENVLIAAAWEDGKLMILELLGEKNAAPGIVTTLGAKTGWFRSPGDKPFAMHRALCENIAPKYFGFCF